MATPIKMFMRIAAQIKRWIPIMPTISFRWFTWWTAGPQYPVIAEVPYQSPLRVRTPRLHMSAYMDVYEIYDTNLIPDVMPAAAPILVRQNGYYKSH